MIIIITTTTTTTIIIIVNLFRKGSTRQFKTDQTFISL